MTQERIERCHCCGKRLADVWAAIQNAAGWHAVIEREAEAAGLMPYWWDVTRAGVYLDTTDPMPICRDCIWEIVLAGGQIRVIWVYAAFRRFMKWDRLSLWDALHVPRDAVSIYAPRCHYGGPDLGAVIERNGGWAEDYEYLVDIGYWIEAQLNKRAEKRAQSQRQEKGA